MRIYKLEYGVYEISGFDGDYAGLVDHFMRVTILRLITENVKLYRLFKYFGFKINKIDNNYHIEIMNGTEKCPVKDNMVYGRKNVYFPCRALNRFKLTDGDHVYKESGPYDANGKINLTKKRSYRYKKYFQFAVKEPVVFMRDEMSYDIEDIVADYAKRHGYTNAIVDNNFILFNGELGNNRFKLIKFLQKHYRDTYEKILLSQKEELLNADFDIVIDEDFSTYDDDGFSCWAIDPSDFYIKHGFKLAKIIVNGETMARCVVRDKDKFGAIYGETKYKRILRIMLNKDGFNKVDKLETNIPIIDEPFLDGYLVYVSQT